MHFLFLNKQQLLEELLQLILNFPFDIIRYCDSTSTLPGIGPLLCKYLQEYLLLLSRSTNKKL